MISLTQRHPEHGTSNLFNHVPARYTVPKPHLMNFPRPPATLPKHQSQHGPQPKRFTLEEYTQLTEIGFFKEDDRIELIRGELIEMAYKGTKHTVCCQRLLKMLLPLLADMTLRCQDPV